MLKEIMRGRDPSKLGGIWKGKYYLVPADLGQAGMRTHFCQMTNFSSDNMNPSFSLKSSKFQILGQHRLAEQNFLIGFCLVSSIFYLL